MVGVTLNFFVCRGFCHKFTPPRNQIMYMLLATPYVLWFSTNGKYPAGGGRGGNDFLMSGIDVYSVTDQGRCFTSKNPEQAPNFANFFQNRP